MILKITSMNSMNLSDIFLMHRLTKTPNSTNDHRDGPIKLNLSVNSPFSTTGFTEDSLL